MTDAFTGRIAGLGSTSGVRVVIGRWDESPLGPFADVMLQDGDGRRFLLAPRDDVAEYVAAVYAFDDVVIGPVEVYGNRAWAATAPGLELTFVRGTRRREAALLRAVPPGLRDREWWARTTSPVAAALMPGVRLHGSAGGDRTEWYAASDLYSIASASGHWRGADLGALADLRPPATFGFSSTPRVPTITTVTSHVRVG